MTLEAQKNQFIGCDKPYSQARAVVFGAPYDCTASFRPGARFGPAAMRAESFGIETYSPRQDRDLVDDAAVFDVGDLELPFGAPEPALAMIGALAAGVIADGKIPVMLGGEHLVTLGVVRELVKKHGQELRIIHFDAHADLREDYLGSPLSHACVLRRCWDLLGDGRIFQFGIRSGTREEFQFMKAGHVKTEPFAARTLTEALASIPAAAPLYLTVDMDVLDPAEFPGTGTQEAGGLRYAELLTAVLQVCRGRHVVGLDNVELCPGLDPSGRSTALACKFLRECLLALDH
ncbi:MAG: agmatinase [Planctomycetes bacterium]|nr:agmatinase [Planctomycetota bacterium]